MSNKHVRYCLDANVLIQAWQKYYSPKFCPDYWKILNKLGEENRIFIPQDVYDEIEHAEDELTKWLKESDISVKKISGPVTECLKKIYAANVLHTNLVDNIKQRSKADPWVIAHALYENASVVTKEVRTTATTSRIKIPDVCVNMGIRCIDDFQMIEELGIKFGCSI